MPDERIYHRPAAEAVATPGRTASFKYHQARKPAEELHPYQDLCLCQTVMARVNIALLALVIKSVPKAGQAI